MQRRYLVVLVGITAGCASTAAPAAPSTVAPVTVAPPTVATAAPPLTAVSPPGVPLGTVLVTIAGSMTTVGGAVPATVPVTLPPTTLPPGVTAASAPTAAPSATAATTATTATTATPPTNPPVVTSYVILSGDTLYGTARAFNVTLDQLRAANDAAAIAVIHVGDVLRLPAGARPLRATDITTEPYTVVAGDSVSAIASDRDTTPAQILAINDLLATPGELRVGQVLLVPDLS